MARSKQRVWGFDEAERRVLMEATPGLAELHAVMTRAELRADLDGLWLVKASVAELDEMYSLVEALMAATRSRKRLELLEGLRATLCTSIDGF